MITKRGKGLSRKVGQGRDHARHSKLLVRLETVALACRSRTSGGIIEMDIGLVTISVIETMSQDKQIMHIGV